MIPIACRRTASSFAASTLKNGYADARVTAAAGSYDLAQKGFVVTFTVDEGDRYRFGTVRYRFPCRCAGCGDLPRRAPDRGG